MGKLSKLVSKANPFKAAKKLIKKFKPDVAIGVGGYASGPLLRVAEKAGRDGGTPSS